MRKFLAGSIVLLALAGCGSAPPTVDWRAEAVSVDYPEPYQRLYLREISLSDCAAIDTRIPEGERYGLDRDAARGVLQEALAGLGIFKQVTNLASANERPQDDGLIVDLALDDSALVHTGERTSSGFWLWLFTGFPGLCVHDQLYSVFYEPRARICDARTGETLVAWEPLAPPSPEGYALSFNERTTGFLPYLACWIIPPTSLSIDEVAVAKKVLPPAMRPTIQSLVRLFNQITFAPVNKVEVLVRPAMGIRVDDVSAPVKGGLADVTVHATLAPDVWLSYASCGDVRIDLSKEKASKIEKPIEIYLPGVAVVPGENLEVEVGIAGADKPQKLVTLTTTSTGELRAEGRRREPAKKSVSVEVPASAPIAPSAQTPPPARSPAPIPEAPPSTRTDQPHPDADAPRPRGKIRVDVHPDDAPPPRTKND